MPRQIGPGVRGPLYVGMSKAIFELGIDQPAVDMRVTMEGLHVLSHIIVWISYAKFEASAMEDIEQKKNCLQHARDVFGRADSYFRNSAPELKEERAMLLEEWLNMESSFGELGDVNLVHAKLPKKLKKRRQIDMEDGPAAYEEHIDGYLFAEEMQTTNLKILEAAYKWKKQRVLC
ncbi:hypothetical protein HAX54_042536 [Datura stramonium]|uniref:Uncharacterized protein n=1 Tax=Datura stramonium TaxID=4076 RepID=A0ABS8W3D1_DATST|nr:hypothetical protein [Datura stramonium]